MANIFDASTNIKALSTAAVENLSSSYFDVQDFGFLRLTSNEKFNQTWYPTPSDIVPAGWFSMDIHNTEFGDFNGDGLMDIIIQPMLFPHVISRETKIDPILLIQNGQGGFENSAAIAAASSFPNKHFLYRLGKGDFNGDGIPDIVLSAMANINRVASSLTSVNVPESPEVIFGGNAINFKWIDKFQGLVLEDKNPGGNPGYEFGHSMAVGDFNGDGFQDFFSDWWAFYGAKNSQFLSRDINPTPDAALLKGLWSNKWTWPMINATASADFNADGYDDLIYSTMPWQDNGQVNGGDLWLASGGFNGIEDGVKVKSILRSSLITGNIGTNFISAADFNGDGHQDIIFMEHAWVTDAGNSTNYYSQGRLRLMIGDGKGGFNDLTASFIDPYAGHRHGEGNIHTLDLNGDGWLDVVLNGFQVTLTDTWGSNSKDYTSVFLNNHGVLNLLNNSDLAYVQPYQFSGEEGVKKFATSGPGKLVPVDIGNDGMVDFIGFVSTPLHSWPQVEQQYTYAYVSKSINPLGRNVQNESLVGTSGNDKIFGFDGNDLIKGAAGNDIIDGGVGIDTAAYIGTRSNHTLTKVANIYTVTAKTGADGTDSLTNVENLTFSDVTLPTSIDLFFATKGAAVAARGAVDVASAIATQISVVYLGRPADKTLLLDLKTALGNEQPSAAVLNLIAAKAIQDGAFSSSNSSKDIVVNTFNNIMGFLPSAYEQTEWAKYIDNGTLTKANAPWIIFQSYLGANNVPDIYKLPTQARFVAAQTFSDYAYLDTQQAELASLNSIYANAARKWLSPVDSVSHAASKMQTIIADVESVTLTGVAPVDSFVG